MSDAEQSVTTADDSYNFYIHGGKQGLDLTCLIRKAHEAFVHTTCPQPTDKTVVASGVEFGLNAILDQSMPKYGLPGSGITVAELRTFIAARLRKMYRRDVVTDTNIESALRRVIGLAKKLSDEQITERRLLQRAGISA